MSARNRHSLATHVLERRAAAEIESATKSVAPAVISTGASSPARPTLQQALHTSGMLGRYRLLDKLGGGGMGVVYAAYDPKLARNVAIKLLHARGKPSSQRRFVREAQAMARLSHPNVVQVYEIGEVGTLAFIVMELVDGVTLGTWLGQRKRSVAEILSVFDAAGRGLLAAHRAGLVHRDFKPDNVMIRSDERVLVMDFGLARREGNDEPNSGDIRRFGPLAINLTSPGAVLGTPAYMAPEQFLGQPTDARTDQFSFCVALWEAIHGQRPFAGEDYESLSSSVVKGRVHEPRVESPVWLRRVLHRGLAVDPEQRWPSMDELLVALHAGPARRRRTKRNALALITALALAGATQLGLEARAQRAAVETCTGDSQALEASWTEFRAQLERAQVDAPDPATRAGWVRLHDGLDDYAREWAALRRESCLAGEREAHADPVARGRMLECLDERRASFEMLVAAWAQLDRWDAKTLTLARDAALGLPDLHSCTSDAWLAARVAPPEDPARGSLVRRQRVELERARVATLTGDFDAALVQAEAALSVAEDIGWRPLAAEARIAVASVQERRGRYPDAVASLRAAFLDATESGHDIAALAAATMLAPLVGESMSDLDGGLYWGEIGARLIERGSLSGSLQEAELLDNVGMVLTNAGRHDEALANYRRSLEIRTASYGSDHLQLATSHDNIGSAQMHMGDYEAALASHAKARELWVRNLGPTHPKIGLSWSNTATVHLRLGQLVEARDAYHKALAASAISVGDEHPWVAKALAGVARVHEQLGEHDEALATYERSLALWTRLLGPEDPGVAHPLVGIARIHAERGDHERAVEALERALKVREHGGASPQAIASTKFALARSLAELSEPRRARKLADEAAAAFVEHELADELGQLRAWARARGWRPRP